MLSIKQYLLIFKNYLIDNNASQHILSTSENLLGFCLFIITSLHLTNKTENNLVDEFTSIVALLLTVSSFLSFITIKTKKAKREFILEQISDYLFVTSLIGIFGIIIFITFTYWNKETNKNSVNKVIIISKKMKFPILIISTLLIFNNCKFSKL